MDTCSYFIDELALFGSYPTQDFVAHLQSEGFQYFIDLTEDDDKNIVKYTAEHRIHYPIKDKDVPFDIQKFSAFILRLLALVENNNKIYIHCRGGHGRSGIVVACLMKLYYKIDADKALDLTYECHQKRRVMRDKWRKIGAPQTEHQKQFVRHLFRPIYYNNYNIDNNYMSTFYTCPITININNRDVQFLSVETCYQAFKNESDTEYVDMLSSELDPRLARTIGHGKGTGEWRSRRASVMKTIVLKKFIQNDAIRLKLLHTGLGEIVKISERKSYWNNIQHNRMGALLEEVRNELSLNNY